MTFTESREKFGSWDFSAKNSERVSNFARKFIKNETDPTDPWQILHGHDANSYREQFSIVSSGEAVPHKEDGALEENEVFSSPGPFGPQVVEKYANAEMCLNAPLKQWPQLLPNLTEDDACSLLQEICENSSVVSERHVLVAQHLLLPRLQNGETVSRKLAFSAVKFVSCFPAQSVRFLLTDLIVQAPTNEHHLDVVKEMVNQLLNSPMRAVLLSSVISSLERLHKSHIQFLLLLIGTKEDAETKAKLVTLLVESADDLTRDIGMGRLIIAVIRLGPAQPELLSFVVEKHQTALKNKAAKLLSEIRSKSFAVKQS